MIELAHIQGVPVEEFLIPWLSGGAGGLMIVLATSVGGLRLIRKRRKPGTR